MSHDATYIYNIKYETNELNLQNRNRVRQRTDCGCQGGGGSSGYGRDKQKGPTVQHRKLYSIFCNKPQWNI